MPDEILDAARRAVELSDEGKVGMAPREKWGLRPRVARQFSDSTGLDLHTPGVHEETNRAARAKAREFVTEEDAREFLGASAQEAAEKPPRSAWSEAESNLFDAAEAGTTGFYKSNKQKLAEYLETSRVNTTKARESQRTAKQQARWEAQDERDRKIKEWLEGKTADEVNQLVASEQFSKLSDLAQNRVYVALEELGYEAAAEVEINVGALEEAEAEQQFQMPAPTEPMPWENRAEQVDDEGEEDYSDDEDASTEFAGGRF